MRKVYSVGSVTLEVLDTRPRSLLVAAVGRVVSSGWGQGRLLPHSQVGPPADGILEFDFVASAPEGPVLPAYFPIVAQTLYKGDLRSLRGVRVHASIGRAEAFLRSSQTIAIPAENVDRIEASADPYPEGLPLNALIGPSQAQEAAPPPIRLGGTLRREATVPGEGPGYFLEEVLVELDPARVPDADSYLDEMVIVEGNFELPDYPRRGRVWTLIATDVRRPQG